MGKKLIQEDEYSNIVDMYKSGLSQQQIADIYGVTRAPIKRILKLCGISKKDKPARFLDDEMQDIIERYNNGMSTYEISKLYSTSDETIRCWLEKYGVDRRHSIYTVNDYYFDNIETQEQAYILGLFYADGYNNQKKHTINIVLQEDDKHILDEINILIENSHPLIFVNKNSKNSNWKNCYQLSINSAHMSEVLAQYGMIQRKSLTLEYPYWMDESLQRHFIRGYFDGDGHISKQKYKYNMSIVSTDNFCQGVKNVIEQQLYLNPTIYYTSNKEKSTRILMLTKKNDCKIFFDWLYNDAHLFLNRKHKVYMNKYCINETNINNNLISVAS